MVEALLEAAANARAMPERALALARHARDGAQALGLAYHSARALLAEADAHYFGSQGRDSLVLSEETALRAQTCAVHIGDALLEASALARAVRAAQAQGRASEAVGYNQQRLALAESHWEATADALPMAEALNAAGALHLGFGDFLAAEPLLTDALRWAHACTGEAGDKIEAIVLSNMALIRSAAGEYAAAAAALADVAERHRRRGDQAARLKALGNLAECTLAHGQIAQATDICVEALSIARVFGIRQSEPMLRRLQAQTLRLQGRVDEAETALKSGIRLARRAGDQRSLPLLTAERGLLAQARGNGENAMALLKEALSLSRASERQADMCEVYDALAQVAQETGDLASALHYTREHYRSIEALNAAAAERRLALRMSVLEAQRAQIEAQAARQEAQALRESERALSSFLSNMPGMAYRCRNEPDWPIVFVSSGCEALTGCSPDLLLLGGGVSYSDLIHPQDRPQVWQRVQEALTQRQPFQLSYRLEARDGAQKWVLEQGRGVYDEAGALLYLEGLVIDATERKMLERQIVQTEKLAALGEVVAGVAHEINNPLAAIGGTAQLLLMHPDAQVQEDARTIKEMTDRTARIIRSLRTFAYQSENENQQQQQRQRLGSLNEAVVTALDVVGYALRKDEIDVQLELEEGLPSAPMNAGQIEQVLVNLLTNARHALKEATPQRRRVLIKTAAVSADSVVSVSVRDFGTGITPEVLPRIFDPFFTTKDVSEGTGLGLSICHGIVKAHRGTITVDSEPGKGATFSVFLPVVADDAREPIV